MSLVSCPEKNCYKHSTFGTFAQNMLPKARAVEPGPEDLRLGSAQLLSYIYNNFEQPKSLWLAAL